MDRSCGRVLAGIAGLGPWHPLAAHSRVLPGSPQATRQLRVVPSTRQLFLHFPCRHAGHAGGRQPAGCHWQQHAQRPPAVRRGHWRRRLPGGGCILGGRQLCAVCPRVCCGTAGHVFKCGESMCRGAITSAPACHMGRTEVHQPTLDCLGHSQQAAYRWVLLIPGFTQRATSQASHLLHPPHPRPPLQAPSNAVCMWGVPPALRPFAVSMSVVAIHVLGDVPSPPLLGALQGWLQNWRLRCGPRAEGSRRSHWHLFFLLFGCAPCIDCMSHPP